MTNLDNSGFFEDGQDGTIQSDGTFVPDPGQVVVRDLERHHSRNRKNPSFTIQQGGMYRIHAAINWSQENHVRQMTHVQELAPGDELVLDTTRGQLRHNGEPLLDVSGRGQSGYENLIIEELPTAVAVQPTMMLLPQRVPDDHEVVSKEELEELRRIKAAQEHKHVRKGKDTRRIDL